jgi:hypothetical protein
MSSGMVPVSEDRKMHAPSNLYMTRDELVAYLQSLPDDVEIISSPLSLQVPDDNYCGGMCGGSPMRKHTEKAELTIVLKMERSLIYKGIQSYNLQGLNF